MRLDVRGGDLGEVLEEDLELVEALRGDRGPDDGVGVELGGQPPLRVVDDDLTTCQARAEGVADYPDPAMLAGYAARHELYRAAVVATAIASVAAPFILVILG